MTILLCFTFLGAKSKKQDPNWTWASNLVKKNRGPDNNHKPKHLSPYSIESIHTANEISPQYQIDPKDLRPVNKQSLVLLQESVNGIKDRIFQAKAKVYELNRMRRKEKDLSYSLEKKYSQLTISHLERLSSIYELVSLTYFLNGEKVYTYHHEGFENEIELSQSLKVFDGLVKPGLHKLSISAIYKGSSKGIFKYLRDYRVRVVDEKKITTAAGESYLVTVKSFEKGRFYTSFKERPAFQLSVRSPEVLIK